MAIVFKSVNDYGGGGNVELDTIIPYMTSNTTPSGVASASSAIANYEPWKAMQGIDYGEYGRWVGAGDNLYIQYRFTKNIRPYLVQFKSRAAARKTYDTAIACSIQFLGSIDGTNFDLIDTLQVGTNNVDNIVNYFVNTNSYYSYFRLKFVGHNCEYSGTHYCGLTCLQIIGESEKS